MTMADSGTADAVATHSHINSRTVKGVYDNGYRYYYYPGAT
ncbi:hypothetical protein [Parapedomonas caeni]